MDKTVFPKKMKITKHIPSHSLLFALFLVLTFDFKS